MQIIVNSVLTLFLLIFLGCFLGKKKIVSTDYASGLSNFIVKVTMPATVFNAMQMEYDPELLHRGVEILLFSLVFYAVSMIIGFAAVRIFSVPAKERGVWLFVSSFSNNGFMGLPLALSLYGNEGVFLMSIMNMIANLLIFSAGVKMLTDGYSITEKLSLKKMLFTNINIAVVLGLIFYINQWTLPKVLADSLSYLGSITSGLSMIVVGLSMAKLNFREMFAGGRNYILTAIRLVLLPLITLAVIRTAGRSLDPMIAGTLLLSAGLPSPSAASIITEQYHTNTDLGAKMIFLTTLFCLVTIPLLMGVGLG